MELRIYQELGARNIAVALDDLSDAKQRAFWLEVAVEIHSMQGDEAAKIARDAFASVVIQKAGE